MARTKPTFTQEMILEALRTTKGRRYRAAQQLGCDVRTIYRAAEKYPAVAELLTGYRGHDTDRVEDVLVERALAGDPWAVCFYLKTQAKDRGYTERQELSGADGKPIQFLVEVPAKAQTADLWMQQYKDSQQQE